MNYAAVMLAGGAARRLAGADKPALRIGGRPLLHRVLAAVADARPRVVVGPARELPAGVVTTREEPPGAGPVAAVAAGLGKVPHGVDRVALLAADLPFLTGTAVRALRDAVRTADVAVYTDGERQQYLCAVWRTGPLRDRLVALGTPRGRRLAELYAGARVAEVESPDHPPPWYDCDTEADLHRAEAWLRSS